MMKYNRLKSFIISICLLCLAGCKTKQTTTTEVVSYNGNTVSNSSKKTNSIEAESETVYLNIDSIVFSIDIPVLPDSVFEKAMSKFTKGKTVVHGLSRTSSKTNAQQSKEEEDVKSANHWDADSNTSVSEKTSGRDWRNLLWILFILLFAPISGYLLFWYWPMKKR